MAEQQNIDIPEQNLQWTVWIMPEFENGKESLMVMKVHHVIGDGLGIMIMLATLQDNYSPDQWIQTTEVLSCCMKLIIMLLKPFTLVYAFLFFLFWSTDKNVIKPKVVKLDGQKKNAICKPFDITTLKKIGAHLGKATINDVVLGLSSVSIKEYMRNHEDFTTSTINMLIPYSLREIPQKPEKHYLMNDFSVLCFTLDLCGTLEDAVKKVQKKTRALKKSIYPYGVLALTQLIACCPSFIGQLVMMWVVSKATVILSNVPGPKTGLTYRGVKTVGFIALIPGLGDLAFGISAMSMVDRLYMAV